MMRKTFPRSGGAIATSQRANIHLRALNIVKRYGRIEFELIQVLLDVERAKVHRAMGVRSLFAYAVEVIGLCEAVAYAFIHVARKTREIPALKVALQTQSLSVSKASRIVSSLNLDNADELISFASKNTCRQIDAEVAKRNPMAAARPRVKQVAEDLFQVTFSFSKAQIGKLERVQSLEAQRQKSSACDAAVEAGLDSYLRLNDPAQKAERAERRKAAKKLCTNKVFQTQEDNDIPQPSVASTAVTYEPVTCEPVTYERSAPQRPVRTPLTAEQKQAVHLRDQGRCTYVDVNGRRCNDDRWTQVHHIIEVCKGGSNDPENLTTLCWHHHDLVHQLSFPIEGQVTWLRSPQVKYEVGQSQSTTELHQQSRHAY